jgi:hypothetical protein
MPPMPSVDASRNALGQKSRLWSHAYGRLCVFNGKEEQEPEEFILNLWMREAIPDPKSQFDKGRRRGGEFIWRWDLQDQIAVA